MPTVLPPAGDARTVYVLDLSGFVFRAYHALPPLSNSHGEPTHATLGVANMLARLVKDQRPAYLAVAMDSKSELSIRKKIYPEYKATRPPAPPDLAQQMARCRELVEAYEIPVLQMDGYEADDLLAAAVREARSHGLRTVICSADKDLMQLVGEDVVMWDAMRNRVFGPAEVKEKWGVEPARVCDLLALMGDTSDNVPGVQGIGEKTAAKLITEHGSLDGVYAHLDGMKGKLKENLIRDEPLARVSYDLVCLNHDLPAALDLDKLKYGGWDAKRLRALLLQLEFTKLADSVPRDASEAVAPPPARPATPAAAPIAPAKGQQQLLFGGAPRATAPTETTTSQPATAAAPIELAQYETILTTEALDRVVSACRAAKSVAITLSTNHGEAMRADLIGIGLGWAPGRAAYIPLGHRVIGDPKQLTRAAVATVLAPMFADDAIAKIGHDVKFEQLVLARAGFPVSGWTFDTMLASYLNDPERHAHRLDEIALAELDHTMHSADALLKRERKSVTIDEVEIASVAPVIAERSDMVLLSSRTLAARLEEAQLDALLRDLEMPLTHVLSRMEATGVLVDVAMLTRLSAEFGVEIDRLEKKLHELAGREFNVNSPRQLETILFDELKLPSKKKTKTSRSTDHEVLEELGEDYEIARRILEHRSLSKLKGTYLDALPALVNPATKRIHTTYSQAVAATGRLSSNNPNLQNIPIRSEQGGRIREAFVAPPGCKILSADYSQIELRVLAHLSRDPILVDAFQKNEDIHTRTAMEIFKVEPDAVTRDMRAQAKTTNFAVLYGQGQAALSRRLGIPRAEASRFIEKYFQTFPGLTTFLDQTVKKARGGEAVRTLLGRRRFLPTISSENRGLRAQAERIAKNTPIQGTAADIMKLAMIHIARKLEAASLRTRMVLTVHDELVFEVPEGEEAQVGPLVRDTMESAIKLDVPLVVGMGWGANWGAAH